MKKLYRNLTVLLLFIGAATQPAFAQFNAGISSVSGGGTALEFGEKSSFVFNAVRHKNGGVNGHLIYQLRAFDFSFQLSIDCFQIEGNRATLSGVLTSVSGANIPSYIFPGSRASFSVEDNGKGGNKDRISDVFFGAQCWDELDTYLRVQGNITIRE
jgi:hypothetical protein